MNNITRSALGICLAALLSGCGGSDEDPSGTGTLGLAVTDAPVDGATHVVVKFTAVELKPANGDPVTYNIDPDKSVDLILLAGGGSAVLLDGLTVPAGNYEWMRLLIAAQQNVMDSYIEFRDGTQHPLFVPSGEETGLKLIRGFSIAAGGRTDFIADFDLRKSVVAPPGQAPNYLLKPVVRLIDRLQVGVISGTVATALVPAGCTPFVYVFGGSNVVPDDLDPAPAPDVDPLLSVPVNLNTNTGVWGFRVSFVEAGSYTTAFTCDGAKDAPDAEDTLVFSPPVNATVTANQTTTISF